MNSCTIFVLAALFVVAAVDGSRVARRQASGTAATGTAAPGTAATGTAAAGGAAAGGSAAGGAAAGGATAGGAGACDPATCVCFPRFGCFRKRPLCQEASAPLPESPTKIGTSFRLYTRGNREIKTITQTMSGTSIYAAGLDSRRATKVIIHGWTQNSNAFDGLKNVLLKKGDFNIIMVDWEKGAGITGRWPLAYTQPAQNTRIVGKHVALMLSHLQSVANIAPSSVHIIGASLGAQAAGYAGMYMNGTIGRISGLDPAKPNFEGQPIECKLDPSDAQFVDVIHTNMDVAGVAESIGHIDFFPNGGRSQPGCASPICSHLRAKSFYRASVWTDCQFKTRRCDGKPCGPQGCPAMGFNAFKPNTAPNGGNFCLTTTDRPPYCVDVPTIPRFGAPSAPNKPSGNPNVGTGSDKTTWFNQGKPMSPGINTGTRNTGNTAARNPAAQNQMNSDSGKNSGVRQQTLFTVFNLIVISITARLL